ncbi:3-hydroxyisobutyrate dehydrogenase [Rhizobium sp. NFR07]|nr:3-hydroxyisobutyrate dehydrogenase [Rhizobium sp. NFR07]
MEPIRIGIIGLGRMGRAMAIRLASEGLPVTGWSRSGMPAGLSDSGVTTALDLSSLVDSSDIILLALLDDAAVDAVVGTLETFDLADKLIVDTSTVSPLTLRAHRPAVEKAGGRLVDAPISGGPEMLLAGKAGFYIGGAEEDFRRFLPVVEVLSDRIHHVGDLGHGAVAKLMNNMMLSGMWESLKEALLLGGKAGLDRARMIDVLSGSPAASPAMKGRLPVVLGETDAVGFPVSGVIKDVSVVRDFAAQIDVAIPAMKAALASFEGAAEAGFAEADLATMVKLALDGATSGAKTPTASAAIDRPRITILYCTQCNWLLRAGWMAQELLQTFGDQLGQVGLIPGTGGVFEIRIDGTLIWERKRDGGFPGPKELKQRVRDVIDPDRDLGHLDRHAAKTEAGGTA